MSKQNGDFKWQDSVDLKDYFTVQLDGIRSLIESNDKNYIQRFESSLTAINAALAAADRAVQKAETASEKRFDAVNEFRASLADQQRTLMPRNETEITLKNINDRIGKIESRIDIGAGKGTGIREIIGYVIGITGAILGATRFIH